MFDTTEFVRQHFCSMLCSKIELTLCCVRVNVRQWMAMLERTLIVKKLWRLARVIKMSKKFLLEFINCLHKEPALWQANTEAYKSKSARNKSWEKLLKKYKESDEQATIDTVKKKVNSLRASYRRELHKIRRSEESGAGPKDIYKPSIWYIKELHFLYDQETSVEDSPQIEKVKEKQPKVPTKRKCEVESEFLLNTVPHLDNSNSKRQRDDADVYAEGWAVMFRQLSQDQQLFAKKGIDELLMQGRMNMLTYEAVSSIANLQVKRDYADPLDNEYD